MLFYVDSSAALKLVLEERGTKAMRRWLRQERPELAAGHLLQTEIFRATRRVDPTLLDRARSVVDGISLIALTAAIVERAALLDAVELRSLDALHLAAALELGDTLDGMITYDQRLGGAAAALGIAVVAPGAG